MPVTRLALADHRSFQNIQGGEQRGRSVALASRVFAVPADPSRHCRPPPCFPLFERRRTTKFRQSRCGHKGGSPPPAPLRGFLKRQPSEDCPVFSP